MEENKASHRRKYPAAAPIGGIFVILALIGLVTVVSFSIRATTRLLDNSKEKEQFQQVILPVLMFDPVPFADPAELDDLVLLRSSIWSALVDNLDKYTTDDSNRVAMAKGDVDVACARLFGPEIQLKHQSFTNYVTTYYYDEEKETYLVPVNGDEVHYTPRVEQISKEGDIYSLLVGYIATDSNWMKALKGEDYDPAPDKYMIYKLKKVSGHYQLVAIEDPPEGAVPGVPQIQPEDQSAIPVIVPDDTELPASDEETTEPAEEEGETTTPEVV